MSKHDMFDAQPNNGAQKAGTILLLVKKNPEKPLDRRYANQVIGLCHLMAAHPDLVKEIERTTTAITTSAKTEAFRCNGCVQACIGHECRYHEKCDKLHMEDLPDEVLQYLDHEFKMIVDTCLDGSCDLSFAKKYLEWRHIDLNLFDQYSSCHHYGGDFALDASSAMGPPVKVVALKPVRLGWVEVNERLLWGQVNDRLNFPNKIWIFQNTVEPTFNPREDTTYLWLRMSPKDRREDHTTRNVCCAFDIRGLCSRGTCEYLHPVNVDEIKQLLDEFETWKNGEYERREKARIMSVVEPFLKHVGFAHQKIDDVHHRVGLAFEKVHHEMVEVKKVVAGAVSVAASAASTAAEANLRSDQLAQTFQVTKDQFALQIESFCANFTNQLNVILVDFEEKLDATGDQLEDVKTDIGVLQRDVGAAYDHGEVLRQDLGVLQQNVGAVYGHGEVLRQEVNVLHHNVGVLHNNVGVLHHNVGVLHYGLITETDATKAMLAEILQQIDKCFEDSSQPSAHLP